MVRYVHDIVHKPKCLGTQGLVIGIEIMLDFLIMPSTVKKNYKHVLKQLF
jgi:hypothetical protein